TTPSLEQENIKRSYISSAEDMIVRKPPPSDIKGPTKPMSKFQAQSSFLREDTVSSQAMRSELIGSVSDISSHNVARRAAPMGYRDPYAAAIEKQKESLKLASKKPL
ncbi:hypothetical protein LTR56_027466, partial [Elasticomyces elasticus]